MRRDPSYVGEMLDDVVSFLRRFVVMSDAQAAVVALWVAHSYAIDSFETTAYLHITSPTKRAGKSRLLDVLEALTRKPLRAAGATEAALFRAISDRTPTLLFDEVDAIFGAKAREHEDLRALLNAGFRRGTPVLRCVGEGTKQTATEFDVFCCKALAGIGGLPDTIADRSLTISLKRKGRGETVERFRLRTTPAEGEVLRISLEAWADEFAATLEDARPHLPDELDDRAQDVCEPLLAIADLAGHDWASRARAALIEVRNGSAADDDAAVQLLADIRAFFETKAVDRISTDALLLALADDDEGPWRTWHRGLPITARGVARLLRGFAIHSKTIKVAKDETAKGFLIEQFSDAWGRYTPENRAEKVTAVTTQQQSQKQPISKGNATAPVTFSKTGANPHEHREVTDVTFSAPGNGTGAVLSLGDPGFALQLNAAYAADQISERELREQLALDALVQRALRSKAGAA
jgi:hypothetical protein